MESWSMNERMREMINSREQLKKDLQRVEQNDYELGHSQNLREYVQLMLEYIGDPEPELRDNLIYSTFYKWIHEKHWFSDAELRELLRILLSEQYLFYYIGNKDDQTVYTRTFSVLVVALILQRHREQSILDHSDFINVKQALIRYYEEERDLRGYMDKEGWAHAAAHGADALDELVLCPESDAAAREEVLAVIQRMLYNDQYIFREEEDERMATIVATIVNHQLLPLQIIVEWIDSLKECGNWPRSREQYITRINTKNFLRCIYFRFLPQENHLDIVEVILKTEKILNEFA